MTELINLALRPATLADVGLLHHWGDHLRAINIWIGEPTELDYSYRDPKGYLWNFGTYAPWSTAPQQL